MLFEPRILFVLLWAIQGIGYLAVGQGFTPFEYSTWFVAGMAVLSFLFGGSIGSYITPVSFRGVSPTTHSRASIRSFAAVVLILYVIVAVVIGWRLINALLVLTNGILSPTAVRLAIIHDFLGPRDLVPLLRMYYLGVGLCIYLIAYARHFSGKQISLIFLIGLVSAIATTGRLYLLLFFVASTALLYRQRMISMRSVVSVGLGFIFLFFLLALALKKGSESAESVFGMLEWNVKVYVLSSLGCFNNYMSTGVQHFDGGLLIPNPVRAFLNTVFGTTIMERPYLNPFAEVPVLCNTYTVLYPIHNDLSIFGIVIVMSLLGIFHTYLYRLNIFNDSPIIWYLFALSLYPLIMSVFEDAYFSSLGFWLLLWIPFVFHATFHVLYMFLSYASRNNR